MGNKILNENALKEFEKRYTGYPEDNESIYKEIGEMFGENWEVVADYICIHRYEDEEMEEETIEDEDF